MFDLLVKCFLLKKETEITANKIKWLLYHFERCKHEKDKKKIMALITANILSYEKLKENLLK